MTEEDIRPADLFNKYLSLAEADVEKFFVDKRQYAEVPCPACGSLEVSSNFEKLGFTYKECESCASLYLSPRPSQEQIDAYYQEGESVRFWATDFFARTAEARREKMFAPRARLVAELASSKDGSKPGTLADIGAGFGIFLEEVQKTAAFEKICRDRGFEVVQDNLEDIGAGKLNVDVACAFEVIEHVYNPSEFLQAAKRILCPGGLLVITTLTCSGFDIQTLWEKSKSVHPPHHVNLLSTEGYRRLFTDNGFDVQQLSTPGELDLDIVKNMAEEDRTLEVPRFVRSLLDADADSRAAFQDFLKMNELSSHIRVVARASAEPVHTSNPN
jgi:2-polyprenyl-3-methyl-5-hydroxy-6-metoxy-1,4-benzoquinol methylase